MRKSITKYLALLLVFALSGCAGQSLIQAKPERARDFTVALLQGGETSLSDYAGKPLVIIFGATWCSHCLHEMPILKKACERRKGGVEFLPIFVKSNKEDALALVNKSGMTCKIGWDPEGKVAALYGVTGMPETMFINAKGEIVDDYFGTIEQSDIDKGVEKLIKSDQQQ